MKLYKCDYPEEFFLNLLFMLYNLTDLILMKY